MGELSRGDLPTWDLEGFPRTARFEPVAILGRGGAGVVYEAIDRERGGRVALKALRHAEPTAVYLLKNEFRALQDLGHVNLVRLGELFQEDEDCFFTMELVEGVDLLRYVRGRRGLDERRLRSAFGQLARALSALHAAKKVHLDVKPSNVLVTREGRVVLLDFGVGVDLARGRLRERLGLLGTPSYMAPEQVAASAIGGAADWYAFGVVLYEALTGRLPFQGTSMQVMAMRMTEEPPPPSAVAPGVPPDLDALCAALLCVDPEARPVDGEVVLLVGGPSIEEDDADPGVFVGRQSELAALSSAYDVARGGRAVTVVVEGESGVGKSSLARRFADAMARRDGAIVLAARCFERESAPYKAIDGIVEDVVDLLLDLDDRARALVPPSLAAARRTFPLLATVPAIAALPELRQAVEPQEKRARAFEAIRELLARVAARRPTVLLVDDVHWADADSLAVLATVLRTPGAPPLLAVMTRRRGGEGGASRATFALPGEVRTLELAPLTPDDARRLVDQLAKRTRRAWRPSDLAAIVDEAKGHPLFLHELLRARAGGGGASNVLRLDDALWARASRLADAPRTLLEAVVVAGVPITLRAAALVAGLGPERVDEAVAILRAARLARTSGGRGDDVVEPYHDRVREAVASRLDAPTRSARHEQLARALADSGADPELVATHWLGAGDAPRAARLVMRAAEDASAALAFDRAARLYRVALDLRPELRAESPGIEARLGDALADAGRGAEAADAYLAAAAGAPDDLAHEYRRRAADQLVKCGHLDRGFAVLDEVLAHVHLRVGEPGAFALASLAARRATVRLRGLSFRRRDAGEVPRDVLARIDACWSAATGLALVDTIRGAELQARHLLLALRAGEPYRVARALAMEAAYANFASGGERGATIAETAIRVARTVEEPHALALALLARAQRLYLTGAWRQALEALAEVEHVLRERCVGVSWELNNALTLSTGALTLLGDLDALAARLPRLVREAIDRGDVLGAANLQLGLTGIHPLARDDPAGARAMVDDATRAWPRLGFYLQRFNAAYTRAEIALYEGDGREARARVVEVWPLLRRGFLLEVPFLRVMAIHLRARAALGAARRAPEPERASLLREAAGDARALGGERLGWARAFGALIDAGVAAARGASDAAARYTVAAEALAASETHLYAAAARARAGEDVATWMETHGVSNPARIVRVLAPGE